jgi:hypothetical protein
MLQRAAHARVNHGGEYEKGNRDGDPKKGMSFGYEEPDAKQRAEEHQGESRK